MLPYNPFVIQLGVAVYRGSGAWGCRPKGAQSFRQVPSSAKALINPVLAASRLGLCRTVIYGGRAKSILLALKNRQAGLRAAHAL